MCAGAAVALAHGSRIVTRCAISRWLRFQAWPRAAELLAVNPGHFFVDGRDRSKWIAPWEAVFAGDGAGVVDRGGFDHCHGDTRGASALAPPIG